MKSITERRLVTAAEDERRRKDNDATNQKYRDLFDTDLGAEILEDLTKKFSPHGRRFPPARPGQPPMDPLAAAVRDGEAAVVSYIHARMTAAK